MIGFFFFFFSLSYSWRTPVIEYILDLWEVVISFPLGKLSCKRKIRRNLAKFQNNVWLIPSKKIHRKNLVNNTLDCGEEIAVRNVKYIWKQVKSFSNLSLNYRKNKLGFCTKRKDIIKMDLSTITNIYTWYIHQSKKELNSKQNSFFVLLQFLAFRQKTESDVEMVS